MCHFEIKSPCTLNRVCVRLNGVSCSVEKHCLCKISMRMHCRELSLQTVRQEPPRSVQSLPPYSTIYLYLSLSLCIYICIYVDIVCLYKYNFDVQRRQIPTIQRVHETFRIAMEVSRVATHMITVVYIA